VVVEMRREKRNLYVVDKEAINNSQVYVYFDAESIRFVVSLTDNAGWRIAASTIVALDNFMVW